MQNAVGIPRFVFYLITVILFYFSLLLGFSVHLHSTWSLLLTKVPAWSLPPSCCSWPALNLVGIHVKTVPYIAATLEFPAWLYSPLQTQKPSGWDLQTLSDLNTLYLRFPMTSSCSARSDKLSISESNSNQSSLYLLISTGREPKTKILI